MQGKSLEEIYDTVIDLCSTYISHQNLDDEESKIFIEELNKVIPNMEDFKAKFINLRVSGNDKNIFDNLDLENISYNDIISSMNKLLQIDNIETDIGIGGIKR